MPSPPTGEPAAIRAAARHAQLRWFGVALFIAAVLVLGGALAGVILGAGRVGDIFVAMFACGLSLGTFGSHNDTALSLLRDNRWQPDTPAHLVHEIDSAVLFERLQLSRLEPTPRTAWVLTVLAPLVLAWAVSRLVL